MTDYGSLFIMTFTVMFAIMAVAWYLGGINASIRERRKESEEGAKKDLDAFGSDIADI
tara:strand:+ start:187 stop:360 length:174 start_codon:yes stop_codon:yes gene_type:complete